MALKIRKGSGDVLKAVVDQLNRLRDASVGANVHASVTLGGPAAGDPPTASALTTALGVPTDLPTSVALVNDLFRIANEHFKDTFAHNTAVSAQLTTPVATDLATANTRANAIKAAFTTHRAAAGVHFTNDPGNAIAAADATDLTTLIALLTELRVDLPAHIATGLAGQHIDLQDA
jgi:hypothetical protein